MHFTPASSRALVVVCALSLTASARGAPQVPPVTPGVVVPATKASDAALLGAGKGMLRGTVNATARAELPTGEAALLVATQSKPGAPVTFMLLVFSGDGAGGYTMVGHDEVKAAPVFGAPVVGLSSTAHPVASGALTATVGWRAADGSSESQAVLYRQGAGRLTRLLALKPSRTFAAGSGRPGERHEIEVLPTSTGGFKDVRVRSRECATEIGCGPPFEVSSYTFDSVKYVLRPYAIPFLERIVASSALVSSGAIADYSGAAAVDGRAETAWCEGATGAGWFQKLELTFSPAQRVKALTILPGPGTAEDFAEWTRPKRIRVLLPGGGKVEANLADEPGVQRVALPEGDRVFGLTVVIVDVYKGKREDACIAELNLEVEP